MTANPYASHLGDRNAQEVVAATPAELDRLFTQLGAGRAEQAPAPGKWSPRQIVCHLADCEVVFAYRLRQALAEPHHVIQPFDQDLWAAHYSAYTAADALQAFRATRRWNLALIHTLRPEHSAKKLTHPERGEMSVHTIVETMAGHDLNHLKQLAALAARGVSA